MPHESRLSLAPAAAPAAPPSPAAGRVAFGVEGLDLALGGGLKADGLHEIHAAGPGDLASALGFALLVGRRAAAADSDAAAAARSLVWVRVARGSRQSILPYGPGLAELGIDPTALTLLALPEAKAALRAALDVARDGAAGAVLLELAGRQPLLDLTASRRLALAAGETGTLVLVARSAAEPVASAAHTRWQVAAAPSRALEAGAPGLPAFALTLLRQRGGRDGISMIVEWNRDDTSFRASFQASFRAQSGAPSDHATTSSPPLPRAVPALAAGGADPAPQRNAA